MGLFDFLRGGKQEEAVIRATATQQAVRSEGDRPQSHQDMINENMTNYFMVHDDPIEIPLEEDASKTQNPVSMALRVHLTPLNRTAYIEPYDAETYKLDTDCDLGLLECFMDEEEYEFGGSLLIRAYKRAIMIGFDDAKKGRKAQLLKVSQRVTTMDVRTGKPEKQKGGVLPF